jgi:hypothetical protein
VTDGPIRVAVVGAEAVALGFLSASKRTDQRIQALVRHHGHLLRTRVMANASGRPGPNVVTGDYRRSITVQFSDAGGNFTAVVGTNAPQGRRLEFGFHGMDSLGRSYSQAPLPHFGPAMDEAGPEFLAAIEAMLGAL